jgi:signal transduction histidine kinase
MPDVAFNYVATPVLLVLDRLETPLAIFSFGDRSLIWANASALVHWGARSIDDLSRSANFGPGLLIDTFLEAALPVLRQGGRWEKSGPLGRTDDRFLCTGISIDGHPEALLAEIRPETSLNSALARLSGPVEGSLRVGSVCRERNVVSSSEAMLDDLLEFMPMPALVMATSGTELLKANSAAAQLLQTGAADAAPGSPVLFDSPQERTLFFNQMARHGQRNASAYLIDREARRFEVTISGSRLQIGEVEGVLLMIQTDDLNRVSVEPQNPLSLERIVSRKQQRLREMASHEIRTRLAMIDGAAQRIARLAPDGAPEPICMLVDRIRLTVARLGSLIENAVEHGRNNHAETEYRMVPGQLRRVIAQVTALFEEQADIEIAESIGQLPEIWFDPVLMDHVFVNLVENAIKYSIGRPRLCISAVAAADRVRILVRDWGIGILPEDRERVFAENARGTNVGSRAGSGLGLYIVRAIIRKHGGDVSVVETNGRGTTLMIDLPIRQGAELGTE